MIRAACLALILGVSAPVSIAQTLAQRSFRSSDHSAVSLAEIREIETDLQSGRFRDAQAKAHEVVKKQPTYAPAWVYLGIASVRLDEPA
ncbi:MAG TPA: hypothetical protein VHP35_07125, partial [Terriglobia bacterium]|nr:hypothetical protein [Terriglobia bacterium]